MPTSEVVYQEAGTWLRSANAGCWSIAAIFVPLSISAFVVAAEAPENRYWFASGSAFLWCFWLYMVVLYSGSATACRNVLERIEQESEMPKHFSFYVDQRLADRVFLRSENPGLF